MLRNYVKVAIRNLLRYKTFSLINITGLALGLASAILIILWISDELSYDRFHTYADSTYRITAHLEELAAAIAPAPLAPALKNEFPEVADVVRFTPQQDVLVKVGEKSYQEPGAFFVDSNLFANFSFELVRGQASTALDEPTDVVITQSLAEKYFGLEDPVGKELLIENQERLTVSAILADVPAASHLQFDLLMPMSLRARDDRNLRENIWDNFEYYSFLRLSDAADKSPAGIQRLESKMNALYRDHVQELTVDLRLQALGDIHLNSDFLGDVPGHGQKSHVYLFAIIAILILVAASINFMNLSTARASRRAREVGFRKVAGARRQQLIFQFLTESCLLALISLGLAIGLVVLCLPAFNLLSDKQIALQFVSPGLMLGTLGLTIIIGLFAGSYPAIYLSGFLPVKVLSLSRREGGGHRHFRNALVVTQFVFSIVLIIGTVVVYQQRQFIKHQELGFDRENLVYFDLRGDLGEQPDKLRAALQANSLTEHFSIIRGLPTDLVSGTIGIDWEGKDPESQILFANMSADEQFIDVFDMKMLSGRAFSSDFKSESGRYILNEKAVDIMGTHPDSVVGQYFEMWGQKGNVVGVVQDFHFKPILQPIEPMVIWYSEQGQYCVVRTKAGATEATIEALEDIHRWVNPTYPFAYAFIDEDLDQLYKSEQRLGRLSNIFALLAIFISCLGLYGLSAYLAEQKRKEVGIRKVVGASALQLIYKLSSAFTRPVWLAMALAVPIGYLVMSRWLERFAYHIEIKWYILVLSCLVAFVIAVLTVSLETIKAALANPIQALRSE